jgi:hypothetical protein
MSAHHNEINGHNGLSVNSSQSRNTNTIDGYMAPEEEWEREAVLDPAWERQQKKVETEKNSSRYHILRVN